MDQAAVEWLNGNRARIVMDIRASSPEQARLIAMTKIMQAARDAHIDVDEVEILDVLEVT
jgi:hypothetical protein